MSRYLSYVLFLLITILTAVLYINDFGPIARVEQSLNDMLISFTAPEQTSQSVVIVTVDQPSQNQFGEWPWNRDRIADLLAATAAGEPKAIAIDFDLPEDARQDSAGFTDTLIGQLAWIKQAVLRYDIAVATFRNEKINKSDQLFSQSIRVDNPVGLIHEDAGLSVRKVFLPAEKLVASRPNLGFNYEAPDADKVLRHHVPFMFFEGYYYASLPLMTAATYLGVKTDDIKVVDGSHIQLGPNHALPINQSGQYLVNFSGGKPFTTISAAELLDDTFDRSRFKGKVVFLTVDDPHANEFFTTPIGEMQSSALIKATIVDNVVTKSMFTLWREFAMYDLIIIFALGALMSFVLPRMLMLHRIALIFGSLIVLANVNYFMVSSFRIVPETIYIGLELALFLMMSLFLDSDFLAASRPVAKAEKAKTAKTDRPQVVSSIPVREIRSNGVEQDVVETRALEKSSLNDKPLTMTAMGTNAVHAETRELGRSQSSASDTGNSGSYDPQAIDIDSDHSSSDSFQPSLATDLKSLGRYQIQGTLGKGAMGLVYKGIDPAINRPVALKTIRLDFVNDPAEMAELKERLYREAQAAGKLSHPNIVTIYDVGSEGPLQYIAMEYLQGQTLEEMIKKKVKFNYRIIAQIISQICNALEYAHEKGIVHRDIKPANIMILPDYSVKVMDYGIARIDSNSMTKTGIAMGTPNYISPEQLKGLPTDRRADLFSLGVVMYEMLLGRRPFKGESITALIYSIINHEPEKPSNLNPQIPLLFDHIVARSLQKDPNKRYQKATDISNDLADFLSAFSQAKV